MRKLAIALLFCLLPVFAMAQSVSNPLAVGATKHLLSTALVRAPNTTAYAGTPTAPQVICAAASVTLCVPVPILVSQVGINNGDITGLRLTKSTTGATGSTFLVLLYQGAPTIAAATFDASAYTPKLADVQSNVFLGSWACATQVVNGDNSTYDCTANTPSGHQAFALTDGLLRALVLTTGAYAPGNQENFLLQLDVLATVQ